eukprot:scaffold80859_cov19-Tisochrysis_lutea.AAC.2
MHHSPPSCPPCCAYAEAEVAAIVKEVDPDGKGVIDFPGGKGALAGSFQVLRTWASRTAAAAWERNDRVMGGCGGCTVLQP